jgi:amidophosphoribosyltransferase
MILQFHDIWKFKDNFNNALTKVFKLVTIEDYCGIFGVTCDDYNYSVAGIIYTGLMAIQHRGQLFSGLSLTRCNGKIHSHKGFGIVSKVLNPKKIRTFSGNAGVGHVCYGKPTCTSIENAQPFHYKSQEWDFSIAINGMISNYEELVQQVKESGRILSGKSDIELISSLLDTFLSSTHSFLESLKKLMGILRGAYCLICLSNDGNIFAIRDPTGCKPLCFGKVMIGNKNLFIISSESCALDVLGAKLERDVFPGEIININPSNGIKCYQIFKNEQQGLCFFEYVYFARPDSVIDNKSVADVRYKLGQNLALEENVKLEDAIVVPVPDSGRSVAMGYAWESKIPYEEGLMKNRYVWQLKSDVRTKLNTVKPLIQGKNIILIDDSILSGNTMKEIIFMLKEAGVKSIHVRIGCPPIIKNCKLNDLFTNRDLLIAYQTKVEDNDHFNELMKNYIGSDSLRYQSFNGLLNAISLDETQLCTYCVKEYCLIDENIERFSKSII